MAWIPSNTILRGDAVELHPLDQSHFPALQAIARDARIWEFYSVNGSDEERLYNALESALRARDSGREYPFVIVQPATETIIGSTRLLDLRQNDKTLEIGWTWLSPPYWATDVNPVCKLLLLTFCFEVLGTVRVQFQTSEFNVRSRTAILKIGATFEGILRKNLMTDQGIPRNSAFFSIIDSEWSDVKLRLQALVESRSRARVKP